MYKVLMYIDCVSQTTEPLRNFTLGISYYIFITAPLFLIKWNSLFSYSSHFLFSIWTCYTVICKNNKNKLFPKREGTATLSINPRQYNQSFYSLLPLMYQLSSWRNSVIQLTTMPLLWTSKFSCDFSSDDHWQRFIFWFPYHMTNNRFSFSTRIQKPEIFGPCFLPIRYAVGISIFF